MQNGIDGQDLINAFFAALTKRQLDQCEALLGQLRSLSQEHPTYAPWCDYLDGILANERDRDWADAERIFNRLLRTDLDQPLRGRVLLALGRTCEYQGRWADAIRAYERSLPIFAELDQSLDQVKTWKQIAIACRRGFTRGDLGPQALQQAIEYCQLALDTLQPIIDPSPDVAWLKGSVWNTFGLVHRSLGQWDEAISCYQQDLAICRSLDDRHGMGLSYVNLGEVYQKRGRTDWPKALDAYQKALTLIREFDNAFQETEALANLGFLHQEMGEPEVALDYHNQAIDLIEDLRVGASSEMARAGFFATVANTYANTVLLCLELKREAQAFNYVERARSRAFLDVLTARSPELSRAIAATPMTLAEVQAALPADALLIECFTTGLVEARDDRVVSSRAPQRHRFPPSKTLIFAVTHDGIQVHDAGLSPNDLLPRQLDSVVERHFLAPQIRRRLYDRLFAPVEGLLEGRRRLYVVPHGPLHYIPFQALIAPDGEALLREEGAELVYAPSATILLRQGRATSAWAPVPCLALGYNGRGKMRLRFAEEEARGVAQQVGGQSLIGPASKKASLYDQAADYRMLHFSCHGEFDPDSPLASALYLAPNEVLSALDVLEHLHLRCDLVTLSACESGLSRVRRGDELVGLIRAFMYAGARALVSTLWRVDERSTRILMERFYREIQTGSDFAQALKRAQLYLKSLTRKDALEILALFRADEVLYSQASTGESRPELSAPHLAFQHAGTYLKGLATETATDASTEVPGEKDDDQVFADPFYWAPFILVGSADQGRWDGDATARGSGQR